MMVILTIFKSVNLTNKKSLFLRLIVILTNNNYIILKTIIVTLTNKNVYNKIHLLLSAN